jgi:hypothetical protein
MKYVNYKISEKSELCDAQQSIKESFMNEQQNRENQLWDFIDGLGADAQRQDIEKLIRTDPEWKTSYQELLRVHQLINNTELEAPSLRFSKNVMEEIAKYQIARATKSYINKKIIWGIGGFFIVMIVGILVYGFGQIKLDGKNNADLSIIDISKLDWSRFFTNTYMNIFIMINIVLGLVLLDMWLQRRKQQSSQKEA